jgi:hypothetical protein
VPSPPTCRKALEARLRELEALAAAARPARPPQAEPPGIDTVEAALGAPGPMAKNAIRELIDRGDASVPVIESFASDLQRATRSRAAAAGLLAMFRDSTAAARAAVRLATQPENDDVRVAAAYSAGPIGRAVALPGLTLRLKYEASTSAISRLAWSMARLGSLAPIGALRELVRRGELDACRDAISFILNMEGFELPDDAGAADADRLLDAASASWRERGRPRFVHLPEDPEGDLEVARMASMLGGTDLRIVDDARFVLSMLGEWGVPSLLVALEDESFYARVRAMGVLGQLGPVASAATPQLITMIGDPAHPAEVLLALGRIESIDAVPLLERAASEGPIDRRVAAVRGLATSARATTLAPLRRILQNEMSSPSRQSPEIAMLCIRTLLEEASADPSALASALLQLRSTSERADPGLVDSAVARALARCAGAPPSPEAGHSEAAWDALQRAVANRAK